MAYFYQDEVQEITIIHINSTYHIIRSIDNKTTATRTHPRNVLSIWNKLSKERF